MAADDLTAANAIAERLLDNIETVVHGKREQIKLIVSALMCSGHVLLEDVPGTAKTVLARAIAGSITAASCLSASSRFAFSPSQPFHFLSKGSQCRSAFFWCCGSWTNFWRRVPSAFYSCLPPSRSSMRHFFKLNRHGFS